MKSPRRLRPSRRRPSNSMSRMSRGPPRDATHRSEVTPRRLRRKMARRIVRLPHRGRMDLPIARRSPRRLPRRILRAISNASHPLIPVRVASTTSGRRLCRGMNQALTILASTASIKRILSGKALAADIVDHGSGLFATHRGLAPFRSRAPAHCPSGKALAAGVTAMAPCSLKHAEGLALFRSCVPAASATNEADPHFASAMAVSWTTLRVCSFSRNVRPYLMLTWSQGSLSLMSYG
jgi:hypothetical protein